MSERLAWTDPAVRARYRREASRVAKPLRVAGFVLAITGVALALARAIWWPHLPRAVPLVVLAAALLHLLAALSVRLRRPKP